MSDRQRRSTASFQPSSPSIYEISGLNDMARVFEETQERNAFDKLVVTS